MEGLVEVAFATGIVFARVGAFVMVIPGFADPGPPPRIRLAFALALSLALGPALGPYTPSVPDAPAALAALICGEALIGLAFGALVRLFLAALSVAGQVAGLQIGLAMAQAFDPAQGHSGALLSGFLSLAGVALLFAFDLHHVFLEGLRGGYALIPPGQIPALGDLADISLGVVADAFEIGVRMVAPLIVFGLVFYIGVGVLSKMMPQAQVFFALQPAVVIAGLAVFAMTIGGALLVWVNAVDAFAREMT